MTKVFGVEQALNEYDLLLIGFACLLQLSRQVDDVIPHGLPFFVIHDVTPNKQSAPHLLGHHPFCA
jgi:hypothetical protein